MIALKPIGKSADDLRFFILVDGAHAGGITVHSMRETSFSYGIAIAPAMRRRGAASGALILLFEAMAARGFDRVVVQVAPQNIASLSLHKKLGFSVTQESREAVTLSLRLPSGRAAQPDSRPVCYVLKEQPAHHV